MNNTRRNLIFLLTFLVALLSVSAFWVRRHSLTKLVQKEYRESSVMSYPEAEKLKLGLKETMAEYETNGSESAILLAENEFGLQVQGDRLLVLVFTKGYASETYRQALERLGIASLNTSQMNNIASGYLTLDQIKLLSKQTFVSSISPGPTTVAD